MATQTSSFFSSDHIDSLRNHFLIAMPGLDDPLFANSITYICDHGPDGAMGLIINRALDLRLSDVFKQLAIPYREERGQIPILAGGPVNTQRGFVLHSTGKTWQSTLQITPDIALTSSRDIIQAIANDNEPEDALFILGYSGWSAGQLEREIKENSWLTVPADQEIIFKTPIEQRWHAAAKLMGIDMNLMSSRAGHA
jgi:putative transcriptional regulator